MDCIQNRWIKILALDVFIGKEEIFYKEHLIKIMLTMTKIGRNFFPKLKVLGKYAEKIQKNSTFINENRKVLFLSRNSGTSYTFFSKFVPAG